MCHGVAVSQARIHINTKPKMSAAVDITTMATASCVLLRLSSSTPPSNAVTMMPSNGTPDPKRPHRQRPAHDSGGQPPRRPAGLERLSCHRTQCELSKQITRGRHQNAADADAEAHDRNERTVGQPVERRQQAGAEDPQHEDTERQPEWSCKGGALVGRSGFVLLDRPSEGPDGPVGYQICPEYQRNDAVGLEEDHGSGVNSTPYCSTISAPCSTEPSSASAPTCTPSKLTSKTGSWLIVCWRAVVIPARVRRHEEHRDSAVDGRGHEHELGRGRARYVRLRAADAPAVAVTRRGGGRLLGLGAELDQRGGEQHVAARDLGEDRLLRVGAEPRDRQRARNERRDHRQRRDVARRPPATPCTGRGTRSRDRPPTPAARCRAGSPWRTPARWAGRTSRRNGRVPSGAAGRSGPRGCAPPAPRSSSCVSERAKSIASFRLVDHGGCRACSARRSRSGLVASRWCRRRRSGCACERSIRSTRPISTAPGESPWSVAWSRMTSIAAAPLPCRTRCRTP